MNNFYFRRMAFSLAAILAAAVAYLPQGSVAAEYKPFTGEKSAWHDGFERYDFVMDDATGAITPIKAPAAEVASFGIDKTLKNGKRRCVVIVPKKAAAGNPWSWRGCYWNHQPQTEVELLRRGFHIAWVAPDPGRQVKPWDAWYRYLTEEHGLSPKPAFIGMSKGGVNEYSWTVANPDKVSCIYADNPAIYEEDFARLGELAKHDIPLLNICGTLDFLYQSGKHTLAIENRYLELGGRITVMVKDGTAHHPHSLINATPIADWIERNMKPAADTPPAFVDTTFTKSYYFSVDNAYLYLPEEKTYATCRGPGFSPCYARYDVKTSSTWGITGIRVIVPNTVAPGKPWVFRADRIERDSAVDQALLAKGFHIVIAPHGGQAGPIAKEWDGVYKFMSENGFSSKPVMEGTGAAAGEAYAWAIANPEKVSCVFAENPIFRTLLMSKAPLLENLGPLAKAGVPLVHDCGGLDPWLKSETRVAESRYKKLGGKIKVFIKEGVGHFPLQPQDPKPIVDLIVAAQKGKDAQKKSEVRTEPGLYLLNCYTKQETL